MINSIGPQKKKITIVKQQFINNQPSAMTPAFTISSSPIEEMVFELDENGNAGFDLNIGKNENSFTLKVFFEIATTNTFYLKLTWNRFFCR